ncbi:GNAT family N-acetyltransferase [Novosphingobium sp. Chol11]|uniref:GNAT family N-acetyltransferase n=1 Tax=Novosphingobium sp. Chol11 TaxID=1385763 RepID=UPI0025E5F210|nr:GNAT family N-acetyltransferase [Novosphingobium sp. Chol11]
MIAAIEEHPLDCPVWNMLNGPQRDLARWHGKACRIDPGYGPFAAAAPGHEAQLASLLTATSDEIWIVRSEGMVAPLGTRVVRTATLMQMIADQGAVGAAGDAEIVVLREADSDEMNALAQATAPGPWGPATHRYGTFYGVRREGKLVAMAGERMRPVSGLAEVSGVCTYPEFRGQGFAARLIRRVMAGMIERGDTPFLHSYAENAGAIRLYESLGFRARRTMVVTVLGLA